MQRTTPTYGLAGANGPDCTDERCGLGGWRCRSCKMKASPQLRVRDHRSRSNWKKWARVAGVYVLYAPEFDVVKIGHSIDIGNRLRQFVTALPCEFELLGVIRGEGLQKESSLHQLLSKWHKINEWFFYTDEVRLVIQSETLEV